MTDIKYVGVIGNGTDMYVWPYTLEKGNINPSDMGDNDSCILTFINTSFPFPRNRHICIVHSLYLITDLGIDQAKINRYNEIISIYGADPFLVDVKKNIDSLCRRSFRIPESIRCEVCTICLELKLAVARLRAWRRRRAAIRAWELANAY